MGLGLGVAVAAGLLWELAKEAFVRLFASYVASRSVVYGSLAGIVTFLFWAYVSGRIFMFGAHLSRAVHRHHHQAAAADAPAR